MRPSKYDRRPPYLSSSPLSCNGVVLPLHENKTGSPWELNWQHSKPSSEYYKHTKNAERLLLILLFALCCLLFALCSLLFALCSLLFALCSLLLIYPRLISFESDRESGSARHGWRKERCQPWMAVCAIHFHDRSQNAAGTRRAEWSQKTFCFRFWSSQK